MVGATIHELGRRIILVLRSRICKEIIKTKIASFWNHYCHEHHFWPILFLTCMRNDKHVFLQSPHKLVCSSVVTLGSRQQLCNPLDGEWDPRKRLELLEHLVLDQKKGQTVAYHSVIEMNYTR